MKQISLLIAICLLASCGKWTAPHISGVHDLSVIDDRTDSFRLRPLADPILALFDFASDPDKAAHFRMTLITDKLLNPVQDISIDNSYATEQKNEHDDVDNREQLIYSFYDAIRKACIDFPKRYPPQQPLAHSECFATIASELERLSKSTASQKTLIVFSDLQENSDAFNCYTPHGQNLLQTKPQKVADLLCKHQALPRDLRGIVVYFIYDPANKEEDGKFWLMANIYKQLLEPRGARIIIQANNDNFKL